MWGLTLIAPTLRAVRRGPLAGAAVAGLLIVAVPVAARVELRPADQGDLLRLAALCASVGLAFVLDDPAKPTVVAVPVPSWRGAAVRAAAALVGFAAWWVVAVGIAGAGPGPLRLPLGGLTLEALTVAAIALAAAAVAVRLAPRGVGGPGAAPAVLGVALTLAAAPLRPPMLVPVGVGDPVWTVVHDRWAVLLTGLVVTVAVAVADRRAGRARGRRVRRVG